jgi:hypothetical protein
MKAVRTRVRKHLTALLAATVFPSLIVALGPTMPAAAAGPLGWNMQLSPLVVAPPGRVSSGSVKCAPGTVVFGGGVHIFGPGSIINNNVQQSDALAGGAGWKGSVGNYIGPEMLFVVYAICADRGTGTIYQIVTSAKVNNPPGTQTKASAFCPNGTLPLGGGVVTTGGLGIDVHNSILSDTHWWDVAVNNGSGDYDSVRAQVICGNMAVWELRTSPDVTIPPKSFLTVTATCPANDKVISGGIWSSDNGDLLSNVNSDNPFGNSWDVTMSNASSHSITTLTEALCALNNNT